MGQSTLDELERSLISLPARKGGLGLPNPVEIASDLHLPILLQKLYWGKRNFHMRNIYREYASI